jgi:hypothetical protein
VSIRRAYDRLFPNVAKALMEIRELHLFVQEIAQHAGRAVSPPAVRVVSCAVLANPLAGTPAGISSRGRR